MRVDNSGAVLVTGGSAGIGKAVVNEFLANDRQVISLDRAPSSIVHERLISHQLDLANLDDVAERAHELAGNNNVTTLVHNAGALKVALMEEVRLEDYEYLSALHVKSLISLGQAVVPAMKAAGFGRIIVVSSRAVLGLETRTSYASTKAAQLGLVRTWAMELGQDGITVNAIAPGPVDTPQLRTAIPEGDPMEQKLAESLPVRRIGQPEDISRAVMFLAAVDSGFITGQTLYVCGGASLGTLAL